MALPVVIALLPLALVAMIFYWLAYSMLMFHAAIDIAYEAIRGWVFEKDEPVEEIP